MYFFFIPFFRGGRVGMDYTCGDQRVLTNKQKILLIAKIR